MAFLVHRKEYAQGMLRPLKRLRPLLLLCGLAVSSCAGSGEVISLKPTQDTLIYNYLMVSGMVRGSLIGGDIPRNRIPELYMMQRLTLYTVIRATAEPTARHRREAEEAMQQLIAAITPRSG
ncbi:hypothetical protein LOC54_03230 [Acetobacter sp. AN02]|uniref:hypothetical protein n=1 Tax=Acetobacter sp. AN02 TaxID=2894186 RepID=UPI0024346436|nr:hypothetical protein [Acetobacter sp. AN02]MDG6094136.1 hypothetical protein [Acetobacter sp. AN02]